MTNQSSAAAPVFFPRPLRKPDDPRFSSGPCVKRPGWTTDVLKGALLGRSHRHRDGIARIRKLIDQSKSILGMPEDYRLALVPGSDTGAVEMALWSLLGPRPVEALGWDVFGKLWVNDIIHHLRLPDAIARTADFGRLPDLGAVDSDHDIVFTWNGTTAGVKVPDGDWIKPDRKGLTICDATSAVFAMDLPWDKLDVVTWSWQKVLGGEAAHGMLALSPRAVARLESHTPAWPLPKLFRLVKNGSLMNDPFEGKTINTPSMMAIEDCLDALAWAEGLGGRQALVARSRKNLETIAAWVEKTPWAAFLAEDPATRSSTSICIKVVDPWFLTLDTAEQAAFIAQTERMLEDEGAAFEVANHRDAPPSYRIWGGATVESENIALCMEWIDWAYQTLRAQRQG